MFAEAYLNLIQEIPAEEITPEIIPYATFFLKSEFQVELTNVVQEQPYRMEPT